jgi:regulator of protease activity HflC (stomatin/prohibitin superfamily)
MTDRDASSNLNASREKRAVTFSGYVMLAVLLLLAILQIYGVANLADDRFGLAPILSVIIGPLGLLLVAPGFYMLQPNQAAAITLFGDYRGTDRATGLRWTWRWMG